MIKAIPEVRVSKRFALTMIIQKSKEEMSNVAHSGLVLFGDKEKTIISFPNMLREPSFIKYLRENKPKYKSIPLFLKKDNFAHMLNYLMKQESKQANHIAMA